MAAAAAARDGQTALALRLAKQLAPGGATAAAAAAGNVAFSPLSVHAALALVAAGARCATQAQILAFLGAPSAKELAEFGRRVAERVLADRSDMLVGAPRVLFGGGVWVDASRGGLADAFRDVAVESYKSDARTVNFTKEPEEAVKMINEWVKKATDNHIDTIISTSDIDAETDLVLANAVYFKGMWVQPFHPYNTRRMRPFHCLDGSHVMPRMMWMRETLHVACMEGFKVLKLPYKAGTAQLAPKRRRGASAMAPDSLDADGETRYSMFIFLPDARDGIATMVDVVTAAPGFMYGILDEIKEATVELELPKFKITFNWGKIKDGLCQLGLSLPFSPKVADLRGMYKEDDGDGKSRRPTFLTKVAHMAVVEVNELGTEASAATRGLRGGGGPPPDVVNFIADHPFTFLIMEERSGVIVFAGHVLDPSK